MFPHQAGSGTADKNSAGARCCERASDARGHHRGGNQHPLSDHSSLMGDGVRVLTRAMKKITRIAGDVGAKLRDRSRSVKLRVLDIARAARAKGPQSRQAQGRLRQAARIDQSGGRTSQAVREGDCRWCQASARSHGTAGAGCAAPGNRRDAAGRSGR